MLAVDKYIIKKFLGYTPYQLPPTIEARNDIDIYRCTPPTLKKKLHNWWHALQPWHYDYWRGGCADCGNMYLSSFCGSNTLCFNPDQDRIFARNRKIAGGVALMGLGAGSFYAGRMLYHNADKIMAMLPNLQNLTF
jgi:hypothetical protein